jgi:hypothetical protein
MIPVTSKSQFVKRYKSGEFGNASPTWDSVSLFLNDKSKFDNSQLFHLRNKTTGGKTWYNLKRSEIKTIVVDGDYYVSSMAPSDKTVIQGEIRRSVNHYDLTFNQVKLPMRDAFKVSQKYQKGLSALLLLKKYLDWNSFDWLQYLLNTYENHTVEFSTYSIEWGTLPNFNTVFWEVRNY